MCWTLGHRVPDCKNLTDKQRDLVKAARSTCLRQRNAGASAAPDRNSVVVMLLGDLLGGAESTKTERGGHPAGGNPGQGAPRGGKRLGGVASPSLSTPPVRPNSPVAPRHVTFASPGVTAT